MSRFSMFLPVSKSEDSVRKNSFWLLFARLTAQALAILFTLITARKLGLDGFGHFALIASLLLIGNTFTNFGTDTLLVRETSRAGRVTKLASQALSLQIFLSMFFCIVMIFYYDSSLLVYSLSLFPLTIFSVNNALLRALGRMDLFWLLSLLNGGIQVIGALISKDIFVLCAFLLLGQILLTVVSFIVCNAFLPDFRLFPLQEFRSIINIVIPFALLTVLLVLIQRLGILFTSKLLDESATGLFSSITRIVDGLKLGHYAILGALLPALSRREASVWKDFHKAFITLMLLCLVVSILLIFFADPLVKIMYGNSFLSAGSGLKLLVWSLLPYTVSSFISYYFIARGMEYSLVQAIALSLIVYIMLYIEFIKFNGFSGAVLAALLGECAQAFIFSFFFFLKRKENHYE